MTEASRTGDVIALVMAAGLSRRFGADKRQARLTDGRMLLQTTVELAQASFAETWVVLRKGDDPAKLGIGDKVRVVHAPATNAGLGTSLGTAFSELEKKKGAIAAAVILGDMPWISPHTCRELIDHAQIERIVRPCYADCAGHPVVFGRIYWPELACLRGDRGASEVVRRHAFACDVIDTDDPGILSDIDVPGNLPH